MSGFFSEAKQGIAVVNRAQSARTKVESQLAAAIAVEVEAWRELFAIPGVSIDTAAVLMDVPIEVAKRFDVACRQVSV